MAPLNAVVVAFVEWTLLLDGSAALLELFDKIEGCLQMVPRDTVVGWLRGTLLLDGSAERCG